MLSVNLNGLGGRRGVCKEPLELHLCLQWTEWKKRRWKAWGAKHPFVLSVLSTWQPGDGCKPSAPYHTLIPATKPFLRQGEGPDPWEADNSSDNCRRSGSSGSKSCRAGHLWGSALRRTCCGKRMAAGPNQGKTLTVTVRTQPLPLTDPSCVVHSQTGPLHCFSDEPWHSETRNQRARGKKKKEKNVEKQLLRNSRLWKQILSAWKLFHFTRLLSFIFCTFSFPFPLCFSTSFHGSMRKSSATSVYIYSCEMAFVFLNPFIYSKKQVSDVPQRLGNPRPVSH